MMIKKCLIVTLIVLLPSLGLGQNTQASQPDENNQDQFKVEFLSQIIGVALSYNPMSLKLYDFVFDWIG